MIHQMAMTPAMIPMARSLSRCLARSLALSLARPVAACRRLIVAAAAATVMVTVTILVTILAASVPASAQTVRIDRRVDVGSALAVVRVLVGDHHLAGRPDGGVAVVAVPGAGDVLGDTETPELPETGDSRSECLDLLSRRARVADPDAVRPDCD